MAYSTADRLYKHHLESLAKDTAKVIRFCETGRSRCHELDEYFVGQFGSRHAISNNKIGELRDILKNARKEEDIHKYLAANPVFLTRLLLGNHGSWCIPKPRFGCQRVPDFLIAELDSMGFRWYGIELESPFKPLYTKKGVQSAQLTQALNQVDEWRKWLKHNIDYAQRPVSREGLSLIDIDCYLPCFILIGRRGDDVEVTKEKRRQLSNEKRVEVHHYDWLIDRAKPRRYSYKPKRQFEGEIIQL